MKLIKFNHQYDYMAFRVDGGERVRISAAGDVGIGTQAPLSKLDVRGDISGSGNFIGTGNGNRLTTNGVPYLLSGDVAGGGGSVGTLQTVTNNGATTTNSITIGASSAPAQALDIVGFLQMANTRSDNTQKIARQLVPTYNNSHGAFLAFMGTANADANVISYGGGTSAADAATEMRFYTATGMNTTIGVERIRVTSSGNVGIGTDDPQTLLDIDAAANHGIRIGTNNTLIGEGGATGTQLLFWN